MSMTNIPFRKSLKDISWQVDEGTYRDDKALSYSTLSTFLKGGFNCLDHLFDKKESPSLTFGSAVDALITGGDEEFNNKFLVADFPDVQEAIVKIVKECFDRYHITHKSLLDIPDSSIAGIALEVGFQNNWKPETKARVVKEKGEEYYNLLHLAENKIILSNSVYLDVLNCVKALKESDATRFYFAANNPFDNTIERFYQLKFKTTLNGIEYRCMADLLIVDHEKKEITPVDLKTSSHPEWDFYYSFITWNYQIQARLYWRIIRNIMDMDPYFKDFVLNDYKFIVVNKETLTPLVWEFSYTQSVGELLLGKTSQIAMKDPEDIGKELHEYLKEVHAVPNNIQVDKPNNLVNWIDSL